jgi:type IV pilus assembly protein PilF
VSKTRFGYLSVVIFAGVLTLIGCASTNTATSPKGGSSSGELATGSDQTSGQKRAAIRLQLAVGYYQRNEMNIALDEIKQSLQADPDFSDAYSMRGLIYMQMGETHLADENFQHALRLAPHNADFNNNYGWYLCQNGRAAESISYFEAALKVRNYESPSKALSNAGLCSEKLNDAAAAEKYFLAAFQIDPGNPNVNVNLAKTYYKRKDYEHAQFYIGRVIKANVHDADVLWLGVKIARKSGDRLTERAIASELERFQPNSVEFANYQREAFDE